MKDENLRKEMMEAQDLLEIALCIDPTDADPDDSVEVCEKMRQALKILPKNFPFELDYLDEKVYKEKPLFTYYKGPVYWMDKWRSVGVVS